VTSDVAADRILAALSWDHPLVKYFLIKPTSNHFTDNMYTMSTGVCDVTGLHDYIKGETCT